MVRAATAAVAVGGGFEEMPESARRGVPISVRIPADLARRLDKLLPKLAKDSAFSTLGVINKSSVVKLAILRGVEALEAQYK
jgi:hypothetical protein